MMEIEFVKITKYMFMLFHDCIILYIVFFSFKILHISKCSFSSLFLLEYCKKKENIANIQGGISPTVKQCLALFVYTLLKHNEQKYPRSH